MPTLILILLSYMPEDNRKGKAYMPSNEYEEITRILESLLERKFLARLGNVKKEPSLQEIWESWEEQKVHPGLIPFLQAAMPKLATNNLSFQGEMLSDGTHQVLIKKDKAGILTAYEVLSPVSDEERTRLENRLAELLRKFIVSKLSKLPQRDREDLAQDILREFVDKVRNKKIAYPERWHSFLKEMVRLKICEYFRKKKQREMASLTEEGLEQSTAPSVVNRVPLTEVEIWKLLRESLQERNLFSDKEKKFASLILNKAQEKNLSVYVVLFPVDEMWPEILKEEARVFQKIVEEVTEELSISEKYARTLLSRMRRKWLLFLRRELE